jgi:ADP-heptose:LPS heptosyltransferase
MTVSISFTSALLAFVSRSSVRIGARRIDGKENSSAAFFSRPIDLDWRGEPHRHQSLRNLDTAGELPLPEVDLSNEITLSAGEQWEGWRFVENNMAGKTWAIAFHPGAGKVPNRWPAGRFSMVANELSRRFDARVFVTRGPMDDEPVDTMTAGLSEPPVILSNRPIREVAAVLSHMSLVVSNDTGIMHVAAAVGSPVLSLFGPTDPKQWAPVGEKHKYLWSGPDITEITVEEVLKSATEILTR